MCGIVGYIGKNKCIPIIVDGLSSLEYRGYDSAGIAYQLNNDTLINKKSGKLDNLKESLDLDIDSNIAIGHTRWATHGSPTEYNAHPHKCGSITIVHNGIIENYLELKEELKDYTFKSETDSEVLCALIDKMYNEEKDILKVLSKLKNKLIGSYAIALMIDGENKLYALRKDSPLIIGVSDEGNYIASDVPAILKYTKVYYTLLNNEYACVENNTVTFYRNGKEIDKEMKLFEGNYESAMKNGYPHFMLKEIHEQGKVIKDTINEIIKDEQSFYETFNCLDKYDSIDIVGCGSAYNVGLIYSYLFSKYTNILVRCEVASEYRYNYHKYSKNHLVLLISQSGETADTLACLRKAKEHNIDTLAIVNVIGSSIAREADKVIMTKAGIEIAVATTKAFTTQASVLSLMVLYLGIKHNTLDISLLEMYKELGTLVNVVLEDSEKEKSIADIIARHNDVFYLGRVIDYSCALEASLKLKEISYIHSEAYPSGELKHGTISLIEQETPVISILSNEDIKYKTISNIKEVIARGAKSIIVTPFTDIDSSLYNEIIVVPRTHELIQNILIIIKCQLISYYVASIKECDIDKPRNLAKSVTVE